MPFLEPPDTDMLSAGWDRAGRVVVDLSSHDVGGISAKDFDLAEVIDRFAKKN